MRPAASQAMATGLITAGSAATSSIEQVVVGQLERGPFGLGRKRAGLRCGLVRPGSFDSAAGGSAQARAGEIPIKTTVKRRCDS